MWPCGSQQHKSTKRSSYCVQLCCFHLCYTAYVIVGEKVYATQLPCPTGFEAVQIIEHAAQTDHKMSSTNNHSPLTENPQKETSTLLSLFDVDVLQEFGDEIVQLTLCLFPLSFSLPS